MTQRKAGPPVRYACDECWERNVHVLPSYSPGCQTCLRARFAALDDSAALRQSDSMVEFGKIA